MKAELPAVSSARGVSEDDKARQASAGSAAWASGTRSRDASPAVVTEQAGRSAAAEVLVLRKQIAELQLQNQQLLASQRSQQATIKQLQVPTYLHFVDNIDGGRARPVHSIACSKMWRS